jgi:hypothetical protein
LDCLCDSTNFDHSFEHIHHLYLQDDDGDDEQNMCQIQAALQKLAKQKV